MNITTLESGNDDSMAQPLSENRNGESCSNTEHPREHSSLTRQKQKMDQKLFEKSKLIKNSNAMAVPATTDCMPHEHWARFSAPSYQERSLRTRAASETDVQDPLAPLPTEPWSQKLEPIRDPFTISTSHVAQNGQPYDPRISCHQTSQKIPEAVLQQFQGPHIQVIPIENNESQQTTESAQPVPNGCKTSNIAQYFPPFRGGNDAISAPSAISATRAHNFTLTNAEDVPQIPNPPHVSGAQTVTDQGLLSGDNGNVIRTESTEEGGPDAQILVTYNLEGFRYAKVWLHNPEECPYCDEEFANVKSLQEHIKRTHRDAFNDTHVPTGKVKCEHCDALLMNEINLRRHIQNVHSKAKATISCEICSALFSSTFSAVSHMRDIHGIHPASRQRSSGVRKRKKVFFRCETCGYCSKEKSNVSRHVKTAHVRKKYSGQDRVAH